MNGGIVLVRVQCVLVDQHEYRDVDRYCHLLQGHVNQADRHCNIELCQAA